MAEYIEKEPMIEEMQRLIDNVSRNYPKATETELIILKGKYEAFMEYIKEQPAADVQPVKRGHWINVIGDDYECSECKAAVWSRNANPIENYHYCWRCGAKMDDAKPIKG